VNRSFLPAKDIPTNPGGARHAGQSKKNNPVSGEDVAREASGGHRSAKCIRQFAILVERKPRSPFSPAEISRFIAGIAINRAVHINPDERPSNGLSEASMKITHSANPLLMKRGIFLLYFNYKIFEKNQFFWLE
jgi:hypothetical protein